MLKDSEQQFLVKYTRLNNLLGLVLFLFAAWVYWSTIEPTASFWDCSEFISIDYKLEIGHPPGAPFLQLVAHLVSLLTFGDVHKVAPYINRLSATCSALTIMFLFWTITWFGRKLVLKQANYSEGKMYAVLGAGLIGALAYTFTDSFWFSAVEGEVYAMSSCFTALVFWCITKWERSEKNSERWIILTFYIIGLSIGVHLLCLLAIPAVVFVYYFKKYPNGFNTRITSIITRSPKEQGLIVTSIIAVVLLGFIQALLIPGLLQLAATFELFFVNRVGMHFNSGIEIYACSILLLIVIGLFIAKRYSKPGLSIAILSFTVLIIGYSSFLMLVIRSNAHTPMDENHPSDAINLHAYLGRQQYGDWPLLYGQYYTAPLDTAKPYKDGDPVYAKDERSGKYIVTNNMKGQVANYDSRFCTFFPRMYDANEGHPDGYRNWGDTNLDRILFTEKDASKRVIGKPTFLNNLKYFVRYQVNFMFWKYFMWNFCGRQNDIQGYDNDDKLHGNWITGIPIIDKMMGIPQKDIPTEYANNKARNVMYGLPLLLGFLGFVYQFKKDKAGALVVTVFFFFTGLAIILYLNQAPYQPRERDYSYVGAFYAFAIWIGLGVLAVADFFAKLVKKHTAKTAIAATLLCVIVPIVMVRAEWDDHDRSGRYICRDLAIDYLQSCAPNAILFCNGDNDTFPLWYAQEVEGIRKDVRVCNLSLLASSWYIDQMKRRAYSSAPLPFAMKHDDYVDGTRDYALVLDRFDSVEVNDAVKSLLSNNAKDQIPTTNGKGINYIPSHNLVLNVDKHQVLNNHVVSPLQADSIVSAIKWSIHGSYIDKNTMIVLDMLAHDDWSRPICFTTFAGAEAYMGLERYLRLEGLVYRLVPIRNHTADLGAEAQVETDVMYDNVMHKFRWGNMGAGVYLDENCRRMAGQFRDNIGTLAQALINKNKKDSALKVLNLCVDSIPATSYPYDSPMIMIAYSYYEVGDMQKANAIIETMFDQGESKLRYFNSLDNDARNYYTYETQQQSQILQKMLLLASSFNQQLLSKDFETRIDTLQHEGMMQKQN